MHNKNFWGAFIMTKYLLLCFMTLLTFSCQNGRESKVLAEKDQTIEKSKLRSEMLIKRLERQEKLNRELENEIKNIRSHLAIRETIEEKGFFNENAATDIQILQPGDFHGNEVKNGAERLEWYGIIRQGETYVLKKIKINIDAKRDVIIDREGEATGKRVTTAGAIEPIILISGLKDIQEGEIPFVELKKHILYPGEHMSLKLNEHWTSITAYGTVKATLYEGPSITSYLLEIKSTRDGERKKQIFAGTNGFSDAMFKFIWAGDIDGDGALDLIMDLSSHYNSGQITLFLSSKADEGQLLKKVSEFKTVGC